MSLVGSLVVGVVLAVVPLQDDVGFTGDWERNVEESDDPREKMQEAMEQMRGQGGGGRGGGGSGGGGGRKGGGGGRGMGGGRGGSGGGSGGGERPDVGNIADELNLELVGDELQVDDGDRLRIYYLDGEKHKRETANGTQLETVAELKGNAVYIEEKMERGELDRKFELSPDGGTMVMTVTVKFGRMKDPILIKTVYEKASESSSSY